MRDQQTDFERYVLMRIMAYITAGLTLALVVLRVWVLPSSLDWDTGLFAPGSLIMTGTLLSLAAMAVLGYMASGPRHEMYGLGCKLTAVALLLTGVVMAVVEGIAIVDSMYILREAAHVQGQPLLTASLQVAQNVFGILGGLALLLLSLRMLSEGITRRGIAQWSVLLPVLWMWLRLVNYEVSYASMVRLSDSFFGLLMIIFELVFLFKMARYMSGVGRMRVGVMAFYSMATAALALSAPIVRMIMFLMGDSAAYQAHHLAGLVDFVIGLTALAMGLSLMAATIKAQEDADEVAPAPGMVEAGDLLTEELDEMDAEEEEQAE